jgi:8-oxo-dGTP pyrophosphatase MutT (NUDIX family)
VTNPGRGGAERRAPAVPRPDDARPGHLPPWEGLSPSARRGITLDAVSAALQRADQSGPPPPLGTWSAHAATLLVDATVPGSGAVPAAVLVPLFEEAGEARVLLTRRSTAMKFHRGQVSFPGGRIEPGEDTWRAARREAHEEIALAPSSVYELGWLHPVVTRASGSLILPVVGRLEGRPPTTANPDEVARVFDVALSELAARGVFHEERWPAGGWLDRPDVESGAYPVYFFEVAGETVWGATARLLFELVALVLSR